MTHTNNTNTIKAEPMQAGDVALCGSVKDAVSFINRIATLSTQNQLAALRKERYQATYTPRHTMAGGVA